MASGHSKAAMHPSAFFPLDMASPSRRLGTIAAGAMWRGPKVLVGSDSASPSSGATGLDRRWWLHGSRSSSDKTRLLPPWLDVFRYRNMIGAMARAATTSDVFNAIAEQQRREILVLLRAGEGPVTELARELGMTQPGASKHLRVLREVGLVQDRKAGKQRLYGLDARGPRPAHGWTGGVERFGNEGCDRLD